MRAAKFEKSLGMIDVLWESIRHDRENRARITLKTKQHKYNINIKERFRIQ